jgi:hypothetical protein
MQTKLLIAAVTLVILLLYGGLIGWKGYVLGQRDIQTKWDASIKEATNRKLDTKVKQDEIQNAPVDNAVTVRRLYNHTF